MVTVPDFGSAIACGTGQKKNISGGLDANIAGTDGGEGRAAASVSDLSRTGVAAAAPGFHAASRKQSHRTFEMPALATAAVTDLLV